MRMCTRLDNVALHNRQQLDRAVNGFIHQGEFEAMKMPSSHRAARCGKHQFHTKVTYLLQCMYCIAGNFHGRKFRELVENKTFTEKTFVNCSLMPQRAPCPQISQRILKFPTIRYYG